MDFTLVLQDVLSPINMVFFVLGVFTCLVVQMLPVLGNEKITLNSRDVFMARISHWGGIIAIILVLYMAAGPNGWYAEDLEALTKRVIVLNPEWVSEVTAYNPMKTAMECRYGTCENRTIICTGFGCRYEYPKNKSDAPDGSILFPNYTNYYVNGTWAVVKNISLPRKAEIR